MRDLDALLLQQGDGAVRRTVLHKGLDLPKRRTQLLEHVDHRDQVDLFMRIVAVAVGCGIYGREYADVVIEDQRLAADLRDFGKLTDFQQPVFAFFLQFCKTPS